jgi:hypothetical protein
LRLGRSGTPGGLAIIGRRDFIFTACAAVVGLAILPMLPSPAQDLVDRWTDEELDAAMFAEFMRHWREDPWRVIPALRRIGQSVPDALVTSAERPAGRVA